MRVKVFAFIISALVLSAVLFFPAGVTAEHGDIVINNFSDSQGIRPAVFPHWFHRIRFKCRVCHTDVGFQMKAGSNKITMERILDGELCGACHNGEIAWGPENCDMCHSGIPGLKTGPRGSSKTTGPGIW